MLSECRSLCCHKLRSIPLSCQINNKHSNREALDAGVERLEASGRRRWDSNARRLITLHDFQSCSLDHYETPPEAERVGFEPTRAVNPTAFRERHIRPL